MLGRSADCCDGSQASVSECRWEDWARMEGWRRSRAEGRCVCKLSLERQLRLPYLTQDLAPGPTWSALRTRIVQRWVRMLSESRVPTQWLCLKSPQPVALLGGGRIYKIWNLVERTEDIGEYHHQSLYLNPRCPFLFSLIFSSPFWLLWSKQTIFCLMLQL